MRVVTPGVTFAALLMFVLVDSRDATAQDASLFKAGVTPTPYNWSGLYLGGHLGVAWGNSNWTTPNDPSGSTNFFQPIDTFNEGGSWFEGVKVAITTCCQTAG